MTSAAVIVLLVVLAAVLYAPLILSGRISRAEERQEAPPREQGS